MRRRFIQVSDGSLVEVDPDWIPEPIAAEVIGDYAPYYSHATGKWIEGRAQRREDLAVSGCRPFEGHDSEVKEAARHMKYNEEARDRKVEQKLREILPQMPKHVRGALLHNDI